MSTPYQQYLESKESHPQAIILLRCGNFYVTYERDAEIVSEVLSLTLTKGNGKPTKFVGFPFYALDSYLIKLIENVNANGGEYNYDQVAICNLLEHEQEREQECEQEREDGITPEEALRSHRDFWIKRFQGNGYYPITHFVWHEECQQYDTRWKKIGPFKPEDRSSEEQYECWLYILEHNPFIISFKEMTDTKNYNNE